MPETKLRECTAQEIFEQLKSKNLLAQQGYIEVFFAGIRVRVKDKSSIGNLFQEWFGVWLKEQEIFFRQKVNTQEFPDFLLHRTSDQEGLLEIKVFDSNAGPKFDIANFDAYVRSLRTHAYRLNADYLIFGYTLEDGVLKVKNFWIKKIWQISGTSKKTPIKVQPKQGRIYSLRPIVWFSKAKTVTPPFASRLEFLIAIRDTLVSRDSTKYAEEWFREVSQNYESYFQTSIDSP